MSLFLMVVQGNRCVARFEFKGDPSREPAVTPEIPLRAFVPKVSGRKFRILVAVADSPAMADLIFSGKLLTTT